MLLCVLISREEEMSVIIKCKESLDFLNKVKEIYFQGGLFVYPTETLYGLGANPFDEKALMRLYSVKRRPKNMPISIAVSNMDMMEGFAELNESVIVIAKHHLPGPVTLLCKSKGKLPGVLTSSGKVGIRIPDHKIALQIIDTTGPITSTSANAHNNMNPRNANDAFEQLGDDVDLYIECGEPKYNGPSTIVDCTEPSISIIRKGVIPEKDILALFEYY